jgi:hypothetical protein
LIQLGESDKKLTSSDVDADEADLENEEEE